MQLCTLVEKLTIFRGVVTHCGYKWINGEALSVLVGACVYMCASCMRAHAQMHLSV